MMPPREAPNLDQLQQWMQSVIMHPAGVREGVESATARDLLDVPLDGVEQLICPSAAQSGIARLEVYASAYYARLLEVLTSEFPALVHALGEELFHEFAFDYLQQHPSNSCTLADLSTHFSGYLAATRPPREAPNNGPDWADFLVDLARLERTYSEVFDGPGVEGQTLLQADDLRGIAPEAWLNARLLPVPCLKLLSLRFPVHEYATAVRKQASPALPEPAPTWLVVTRRAFVVRRAAVEETEFFALSALVDGGTVAQSLVAGQNLWKGDPDELPDDVERWFRSWTAAGYFEGLRASTH